jgi:hypothetical protein
VSRKGPVPRKQRTRQHGIAAQSVNRVEQFLMDEGHTAERLANDYGYDLILYTYNATSPRTRRAYPSRTPRRFAFASRNDKGSVERQYEE